VFLVFNPAVRMIRVSLQGFCEVQDGSDSLFRPENGDHRLGPYSAFRYGPLEVLSPGNLPFRMNLRLLLLYAPLSKSYFQWGGGSSGEDVP
jgi:hypothetical protein